MASIMARRSFAHRAETFGLDTPTPWAMSALRLLFHVPRAYQPLVDAWEERYPGTKKALERLVAMGFVGHQGPIIIDTRTAELAERAGRRVARFRTTAKGHRLVLAVSEDIRILEDTFSHLTEANVKGLAKLLKALDLEDTHAKYGLSLVHAVGLSGLPTRTGRWWVERLVEGGYVRELAERYADTREVVPAHWRVTRLLTRQLSDVLEAFPDAPASLRVEFRLSRSRFLDDIDPQRVGISGATDFDHDIACQRVLAALLRSPRCASEGIFTVEPRLTLPMNQHHTPWRFDPQGKERLFYQPDAEMRERDPGGQPRRSVIEYERYQTRRDAWSHIERFLGYLATRTLPFEGAVLRFVVDSESRVRSYVTLIEAFCDYALDHPELLPGNQVFLAVSSVDRVLSEPDPLDPKAWYRISVPRGSAGAGVPVLHPEDASPYEEYFAR